MRLDPISLSFIKDTARCEGRSMQEAARTLIAAGVKARRGIQPAVPAAPVLTDAEPMRGATVAAHMSGSIRHAIASVAAREGRSVSATLQMLVKESLHARGELRQPGNDQR